MTHRKEDKESENKTLAYLEGKPENDSFCTEFRHGKSEAVSREGRLFHMFLN